METSGKQRVFGNKFEIRGVLICFQGFVLSGKSFWNTFIVGEKPGNFRQKLRLMNV